MSNIALHRAPHSTITITVTLAIAISITITITITITKTAFTTSTSTITVAVSMTLHALPLGSLCSQGFDLLLQLCHHSILNGRAMRISAHRYTWIAGYRTLRTRSVGSHKIGHQHMEAAHRDVGIFHRHAFERRLGTSSAFVTA